MKDDGNLNRQWIYKGGYTSVTENTQMFDMEWVQSQEWVPPVYETKQVWVQPPGYYQWDLQGIDLNYYASAYVGGRELLESDRIGFYDTSGNWHWSLNNNDLLKPPPSSVTNIVQNIIANCSSYDANYPMGTVMDGYGGVYGTEYNVTDYFTRYWEVVITGGWIWPDWYLKQYGMPNSYNYYVYLNISGYPRGYNWHGGFWLTARYDKVWHIPPGHWETQQVLVQPGYWKDTSHYETVVKQGRETHLEYTESPHWSEPSAMIPVYADTGN